MKASTRTLLHQMLVCLLWQIMSHVSATSEDSTAFISKELSEIKHIFKGCYEEKDVNDVLARADVKGYASLLNTPDPEACCFICRTRGWPICALQDGVQCHCGSEYGFYGPSPSCHHQSCKNFVCGGPSANSVYYSLDKNLADKPYSLRFFPSQITFKNARLTCISKLGELVSPLNGQVIESILQSTTDNSSKIWLGMHKPELSPSYEWTEQFLELSYDSCFKDLVSYWNTNDKKDGRCVIMDIATKKWSSVDCEGTGHGFVCKLYTNLSVELDNESVNKPKDAKMNTTKEEKEFSGLDKQKTLLMFIVVPIFLICYAGSCLAYCIYKISRNCSEQALILKVTNYFEEERMKRMFDSMKPSMEYVKKEPKVAVKVDDFNQSNNRENIGKSINKILLDKIKAKKNLKNYM